MCAHGSSYCSGIAPPYNAKIQAPRTNSHFARSLSHFSFSPYLLCILRNIITPLVGKIKQPKHFKHVDNMRTVRRKGGKRYRIKNKKGVTLPWPCVPPPPSHSLPRRSTCRSPLPYFRFVYLSWSEKWRPEVLRPLTWLVAISPFLRCLTIPSIHPSI